MKILRKQNYLSTYRLGRISTLLLAFSLVGCGGGDDGGDGSNHSPLPPSPVTQVQVVDGFSVAKPNTRTRLDLSGFVRGRGAELNSFTSEQAECGTGGVMGLTAEVDISEAALCQYRFTARSGSSEGTATLSVLSTLAATPVLEPLSAVMTLTDSSKTFDLEAMYEGNFPSGYKLKADSISVQGGTMQGEATANEDDDNTITYTQPGSPVWNRVLFILQHPSLPDEDILGTLYITVSESANQAPTINNVKYNYSDGVNVNPAIVTFQAVTLDLANLGNLTINDPEGNQWQLIEVQSYSASVVSTNPGDVTNKRFNFQAGTVGEHIVSYIVGDHDGGFRMGLMSIYVGPKELPKDWGNIDLVDAGKRFYAPPLYSEIKNTVSHEYIIEPVWDADVNGSAGNTVGAVGNLAATAYCSGKRLPTQADLNELRAAIGQPATELAKYPKARPYLISNATGETFQTYNLTSGDVASYVAGANPNPYVMCVTDHGLSYTPTPNPQYSGLLNTVVSDGTWQEIGTVSSVGGTASANPTLFGLPTNAGTGVLKDTNFRLSPQSCAGGSCKLEAQGASDEYGVATAQMANGVITTKTLIVPVTFLQNAQVTAVNVTMDNAPPSVNHVNQITLTLTDRLGGELPQGTNVILNYAVTTTPIFTPVIVPASGESVVVGPGGTVVLDIKSSTVGTVTVSNPSVVGGLPPTNIEVDVTFDYLPTPAPFIKPDEHLRTWADAKKYCEDMGARLPTSAELQTLYLDATSATKTDGSEVNYEMCSLYGWPLIQGDGCGGQGGNSYFWTSNYWSDSFRGYVIMHTGESDFLEVNHPSDVACVRI